MTPDQTAQLNQLREGAAFLTVTLESIRVSESCDPVKIRIAEALLKKVLRYAEAAIRR